MKDVEPSVMLARPITFRAIGTVTFVPRPRPTRTDVHGGGVGAGQSTRPMNATSRASPVARRGACGCGGVPAANPGAGAADKVNGTAALALLNRTIRPAPQFCKPWSTQSAPGTVPTIAGQTPTAWFAHRAASPKVIPSM